MSGNSAVTGDGGGIYNIPLSTLTVTNSTVAGNSAPLGGGGIFNGGVMTLKGTIVAKGSSGVNCTSVAGSMTSLGYNLSDDASCTFLTATGDLKNTAAGLVAGGPQDNGGPTKTIALLANSAAVDQIPAADCAVATDQRGTSRPQGAGCDIGAFEYFAPFSSFSAKLKIVRGIAGSLDLNATFTKASGGPAIDAVTQPVKLRVGTYEVAIPAGSFHQLTNGSKKGSYVYSGAVNNVALAVQIVPLGGDQYQFKVTAGPVDTSLFPNPVAVSISIGLNTGTVNVSY